MNADKIFIFIKKVLPKGLFRHLQPAYHFLLSGAAALLNGFPSEKLIVIGVTGTTGKTTSVVLIARALEAVGYRTGFTSTAIFNDGRQEWLNDKKMTMVGRFFTQRMLRRMVKNGCRYAVIETTSQGILQYRHRFINYDAAVFTGLYPEHIEAHGSFAAYRAAKLRLFDHLMTGRTKYVGADKQVVKTETDLKKLELVRVKKTIIANLDDEHAGAVLERRAERKIGYTTAADAAPVDSVETIHYRVTAATAQGTILDIEGESVRLGLIGAFNAANALTAFAAALSQDIGLAQAKAGIEQVTGVAGRMERIDAGQPFTVLVDYAYEPRAVEKLYEAIVPLPHGRVIHVLGSAGGGRDVSRRPVLGRLAGERADIVIVTNEDPYDDDPAIIIDQVAIGAEHAGKTLGRDLFKIQDRREAIIKALAMAEDNDLVILTGKGSEQAIVLKDGEKLPWDDRAIVRAWLLSKYKDQAG